MPKPLSEQLRPQVFEDFIGQKHLFERGSFFSSLIEEKKAMSLLFWGPPGCGKTTLAKLYAKTLNETCYSYSAVSSSLADLKALIKKTQDQPLITPRVLIFLDEIHRFNKSQQDFFLPYLENGQLILIGATTENPSFSLNNALLSRLRVLTLKELSDEDLLALVRRYEKNKGSLNLTPSAQKALINYAHGDGRYLCNLIENIALYSSDEPIDDQTLEKLIQRKAALFDKASDGHYNLISALHKSLRGSDPDASLYWLARLLNAGEDPLFIARRLIRCALEDVGLADPRAHQITLEAYKTYQLLGSPEGELALYQATLFLALSPKSNAVYMASKKASQKAEESKHLNPPKHILNAPTSFMKEQGYGKNYAYDHDTPYGFSGQNYFPEEILPRVKFYEPKQVGVEREMQKRLAYFEELRNKLN